jgi:hypothetical protein
VTFAPKLLAGASCAAQRDDPVFRACPVVKRSLCLLALVSLGCADGSGIGEIYPVRGKISFDGQPLVAESTTVLFQPDAERGNDGPCQAIGTVDRDGDYTLKTQGQNGACPGWYKVVVTALAETPRHATRPNDARSRPVAKSLLPARYGQAQTTPLAVHVVAEPEEGAYDLNLTSE